MHIIKDAYMMLSQHMKHVALCQSLPAGASNSLHGPGHDLSSKPVPPLLVRTILREIRTPAN
jgi:hypothetical protein